MRIRVSGKDIDIGDSLQTHVNPDLGATLAKYAELPTDATVTLSRDGHLFCCEIFVHQSTGLVVQAKGGAADIYAGFEVAREKADKQLRRHKRRLKDHHNGNGQETPPEVAYRVMESGPEDEEELPADYAPAVVAESSKQLRTMTVASAVMALDLTDDPVLIFKNAGNNALNVVYRRNDGNIGWIDAASTNS